MTEDFVSDPAPLPACVDAKIIWADTLAGLLLVNCIDQADPTAVEAIWAWRGDEWELLSDYGPPAHVVTGFGWDPERNVLVRYGGIPLPDQACSAETWEWNRFDWRQIDAEPPEPCDHVELAWDASAGRMLLVGGGRGQDLHAGTWTWDGSEWTLEADDGPAPRAHHGLAGSVNGTRVELFGGLDTSRVLGDSWSWDGSAWEERSLGTTDPGPRSHHGMAAGLAGVLMFGGATTTSTFDSLVDETWLLGDSGWTRVATDGPSPSPRGLPALGYDPDRDVYVLYGGFDSEGNALGDTWEWDGGSWRCITGC